MKSPPRPPCFDVCWPASARHGETVGLSLFGCFFVFNHTCHNPTNLCVCVCVCPGAFYRKNLNTTMNNSAKQLIAITVLFIAYWLDGENETRFKIGKVTVCHCRLLTTIKKKGFCNSV